MTSPKIVWIVYIWVSLSIYPAVIASSSRLGVARLWTRDDCRTVKVASGDSCGSLAQSCGISSPDFTKFNTDPKLCSNLAPGQRVCCSSGSLPDIKPLPDKDGSCARYIVKKADTCSSIAANNGLTEDDMSKFNDNTTWGWGGCNGLMEGLAMCISTGNPPLPASLNGSVCGPTKTGTKPPNSGQNLADLNPCPLNACCNIWGQCGISPEYCTAESGLTGNPGTAPPNKNGCISNCGTDIVNNKAPPASFMNVGYYESWNMDRPCLTMKASSINTTLYTHTHWGFATVSDNWDVSINDTHKQFSDFVALNGTRRIVSIGGWGYSTDPTTYDQLRQAMMPENAGAFSDNIINFIVNNTLDGVDFDWEYPGAPDIPGIPSGKLSDGPNYLSFLQLLQKKMPQGKTVSIAAPASYWYLQAFPIADMAKVLDYIVYMTYDLHGQWDFGNKYAEEGCANGNCLRSHINSTETGYVLAMLTKAGVATNKITVGVSSYGRAFEMTTPGCTGPTCLYVGPQSAAQEGNCTQTAGYISNAEINQIVTSNTSDVQAWYDKDSDSSMVVYQGKQWIAYMDDGVKASRINKYKDLNFAGAIDWALDLQSFDNDVDNSDVSDTDDGDWDASDPGDDAELGLPMLDDFDEDEVLPPTDNPLSPCNETYNTIDELDAAAGQIPYRCKTLYTISTLSLMLNNALQNYTEMMKDGYDGKFQTYAESVSGNAAQSVQDFVNQNGNKYFSCIISEVEVCCDYCKNGKNPADQCNYCFNGKCSQYCDSLGNCHSKREGVGHPMPTDKVAYSNQSEPCPPDYSKRGYGPNNPYEQSVYWTLNNDKVDQFYGDMLNSTGIAQNKTKIGTNNRGNACPPSAKPNDVCWGAGMDYGIPMINNYGPSDVTNPKDLFIKALSNATDLGSQLTDAILDLRMNAYTGDGFELIDSLSLPVFMVVEASENMATVDSVAEKIDAEKRKSIILAVIGAILFFIPIVGEVVGSVAEGADIAAIVTFLGVAGNAAMDTYTALDDPQNAPLAILGLILAPLALSDVARIGQAANIRRGMSDGDVAKLGGKMAGRMATINKITGLCRKS